MGDFFDELQFNEIIKTENADRDELQAAYSKISKKLAAAHRDKTNSKKILLYCYYSGHGVMDSTTKVVTNEEEAELRYYSLESLLSVLSGYRNSYVCAVFDCCRENMPKED